jgi:D-glycero-beta-D-manno-heptose-7-phosphate kinase
MIKEIMDRFGDKKVLVLGDIMLDHYIWGRVERISPEAPVPVLEAQSEEYRLGGAANVALNVHSLGARAILIGVVGEDRTAEKTRELMIAYDLDMSGLVSDPERPTTLKTRIGAVNQQIVRIDFEAKDDVNQEIEAKIRQKLDSLLPECDALIIEDYNKGLLTAGIISYALTLAMQNSVPVAVDPKRKNFMAYQGVDVFKPNYREIQQVFGTVFENDQSFYTAAQDLKRENQIQNLIVTHGSKGMYVFFGEDEVKYLPTFAREVFDVSGAGDTVISAVTLAFISGADIALAAEVANHAAGVVCGIQGTASVSCEEILASYHEQR